MKKTLGIIAVLFLVGTLSGGNKDGLKIKYEKYKLKNGLEVILHEDHSDPIVAVATLMHVGSNREKPGKTGFAHFFEHMSFNDSENTPRGANRKLIPEWGGDRNGGTWEDGTIFYEVIPTDAFEKIMWIDSDRLGFMINTVTKDALEREKQVVKNEKRQNNDNVPYGHTDEIISRNLYPAGHPYSWTVIGSLQDLQNATLDDVKEFYNQYYGANNATLVIAGDIDIAKTKKLVERWFGEIRKGPEVKPLKPMSSNLKERKLIMFEDQWANLPELRMIFPTVENYNKDSYALSVLAQLLAGNKKSPFYKVIVENKKLAPGVNTSQSSMEIAGEFKVQVRANANVDLDDVYKAIIEGFEKFEKDGISDNDLNRIKAKIETDFYQGISGIFSKAQQLAVYNEYAGDPGFLTKDISMMQSVTKEDVKRVYKKYIQDKNYILTSFVPKGKKNLAVENSVEEQVFVEPIVAGKSEENVTAGEEANVAKTPTKYDRSEPGIGSAPLLKLPDVWQENLQNGIKVFGIQNNETPMVNFSINIKGGHSLDPVDKSGISNFLTRWMMQGTKNKTPEELEEAIDLLGATLQIYSSNDEIVLYGSCLKKNFDKTVALAKELLFEPRWDEKEFTRLKNELLTRLKGQEVNPNYIAQIVYNKLLFGGNHIMGIPAAGTLETVSKITMDDLKKFYENNFASNLVSMHIAGDLEQKVASGNLSSIASALVKKDVAFPVYKIAESKNNNKIFFVDIPDAKQSIIRFGKITLPEADKNYNKLDFSNVVMGGGSSGRLFQILRIEKGYTYGAYSFVVPGIENSQYIGTTSVRSNITLEAMQIIKGLYEDYKTSFNEKEMEITKNKVIKDATRNYESLDAKLGYLTEMSKYNKKPGFVSADQQELLSMQLSDFKNTIEQYLNEKDFVYVIVGDAKTQKERLKELKKDEIIDLDIYGNKK